MALTLLAIGAHMDDIEYGIGGILIQAINAGHRVVAVVAVSDYSTRAVTKGREEACKSSQLLLANRFGYEKRFLDYPYHQLQSDLKLKQKLSEIYLELQPDITFVHNTDDHWPDHINCGIAAKDAVLFAHGYTDTRDIRRCPQVFAYNLTPHQTIDFTPDHFVNITDVMPQYLELLLGIDCCSYGREPNDMVCGEIEHFQKGIKMKFSPHGWLRLVQCAQWGDQDGCGLFALGLKTLWGSKGETLFV